VTHWKDFSKEGEKNETNGPVIQQDNVIMTENNRLRDELYKKAPLSKKVPMSMNTRICPWEEEEDKLTDGVLSKSLSSMNQEDVILIEEKDVKSNVKSVHNIQDFALSENKGRREVNDRFEENFQALPSSKLQYDEQFIPHQNVDVDNYQYGYYSGLPNGTQINRSYDYPYSVEDMNPRVRENRREDFRVCFGGNGRGENPFVLENRREELRPLTQPNGVGEYPLHDRKNYYYNGHPFREYNPYEYSYSNSYLLPSYDNYYYVNKYHPHDNRDVPLDHYFF